MLTGGVFPGRRRGAERRRVKPSDIGKGPQDMEMAVCAAGGGCRERAPVGARKYQ